MWAATCRKNEERFGVTPALGRWSHDAAFDLGFGEPEYRTEAPSYATADVWKGAFAMDRIAGLSSGSRVTALPARPPGDIAYVSGGAGKTQIVTYIELKYPQSRLEPWCTMQASKPDILWAGGWTYDFGAPAREQERHEYSTACDAYVLGSLDLHFLSPPAVVVGHEMDAAAEEALIDHQLAETKLPPGIEEWFEELAGCVEIDLEFDSRDYLDGSGGFYGDDH